MFIYMISLRPERIYMYESDDVILFVVTESNRLHIELPSAFEGSVLIMSKSGTGMAMFSMGEYTDRRIE